MKKVFLLAAMFAASMSAHAEKESGVVLGVALPIDTSDFIQELDDDLAGSGISLEEDSFPIGVDLYAGLNFAKASTVRVGYRKFGQQSADVEVMGFRQGSLEVDTDGLYAALDVMFPVTDMFYLGGTLGLQEWETEVDIPGDRLKDDGKDVFFGVRAKWFLGWENGVITASIDRYDLDTDFEQDLEYVSFSGGLEFRF